MASIATYDYHSTGSNPPNRRIEFSRSGPTAGSIQAQVFVLTNNARGQPISTVPGNKISVEMMNTTEKARTYITRGKITPAKSLTTLTVEQQDNVLHTLAPTGQRTIEIENGIGEPGGLERVAKLVVSALP